MYRDAPAQLLCPRCGDLLDRAFDLVHVCMQCEGVWLTPAVLRAAFEDIQWPAGRPLWWRNSIQCPECRANGVDTTLRAVTSSGVVVDRCPQGHGLYLDRGELAQLMRTPGDELTELMELLASVDAAALEQRRASWRAARSEREAAVASRVQALADQAVRRRAQDAVRAAEEAARAEQRRLAEAQWVTRRQELRDELDELQRLLTRTAGRVFAAREHAKSVERAAEKARAELAEAERVDEAAKARLDAITSELAQLDELLR